MGRRESDLVNNMLTSEKMYIKAKKKFSNNERFIGTGLDIYKYLLKHEKNLQKIGFHDGTNIEFAQRPRDNSQYKNDNRLDKLLSLIYNVN